MENDKFIFWFPAEIVKATSEDDELSKFKNKRMILRGVASTNELDLDDQILKSGGFDISYLLDRGFVNWHHQAKNNPDAIIGEPIPSKTRITQKGLEIEAELYDCELGRKAYQTALLLQNNSKTGRKLGWSIEGKAKEKKGNIITKAVITGVALTYAPKNAPTFAEVVKAFSDDDVAVDTFQKSAVAFQDLNMINDIDDDVEFDEQEKAMMAGNGRGFEKDSNVLKKESLEKDVRKVTKPKIIPTILLKVLNKYPNMDLDKALDVHDLLVKKFSEKILN